MPTDDGLGMREPRPRQVRRQEGGSCAGANDECGICVPRVTPRKEQEKQDAHEAEWPSQPRTPVVREVHKIIARLRIERQELLPSPAKEARRAVEHLVGQVHKLGDEPIDSDKRGSARKERE